MSREDTMRAIEELQRQAQSSQDAGEAADVHEWLDSHGIPKKVYDPINGKLSDIYGKYYLIPLIDRIRLFISEEKRDENPQQSH